MSWRLEVKNVKYLLEWKWGMMKIVIHDKYLSRIIWIDDWCVELSSKLSLSSEETSSRLAIPTIKPDLSQNCQIHTNLKTATDCELDRCRPQKKVSCLEYISASPHDHHRLTGNCKEIGTHSYYRNTLNSTKDFSFHISLTSCHE